MQDIRHLNSKYMYPLLYTCCGNLCDEERETLKDRVVALSIELVPIHETLGILVSTKHPRKSVAVADKKDLILSIFLAQVEKDEASIETGFQRALRKSTVAVLVDDLSEQVDSSMLLNKHEWLHNFVPSDLPDNNSLDFDDLDITNPMQFESDAEQKDSANDDDEIISPRSVIRQAASIMTNLDADGGGTVSKEEWIASGGTLEVFERWDFSGDGELDKQELEAMVSAEQELTQVKALSPYQIALAAFVVIVIAALVNVVLLVVFLDTSVSVINNDKVLIQCQSQSHSQLSVSWLMDDHQSAVARAATMIDQNTATVSFSTSQIGGTYPAVLMGWLHVGMPYLCTNCLPSGSLFTIWKDSGHVYSSEVTTNQKEPVARLYR